MTHTFNWKLVFKTQGALLLIEAFFMMWPTLVSMFYHEADSLAFEVSTGITLLAGFLSLVLGRHAPKKVAEREGYVIVGLIWIVFSIFGMLPFYFSGALPSITDAFFETMSGFSTFGGTVITDLESQSHGILFWRALTQWLGGMGIIVLSIAVLPMFGLGGMQLYAAEVTGVSYEKLGPRISGTAKSMWILYIALTLAETLFLWLAKMPLFDSVCHSMATIATGGFSTNDDSIMVYGAGVQWIIAIFMYLSGLNFTLLIFLFRGKPGRIWKDEEARWYTRAIILFTLILAAGLFIHYGYHEPDGDFLATGDLLAHGEKALRKSFFMVTSAITSTGFAASDYMTWPPLFWVFVFFIMLMGGCAGSTAGGMKQVRVVVLAKNVLAEFKRRIHPNAIVPVKLNGKPVSRQTMDNVTAFIFLYCAIIILTVMVFCTSGVNFDEAIGTAFSAIGNVGVSIGQFGPAGNYSTFPTVAKWWMSGVMLIGRLELFTVLLLFSPALWKD